MNSPDSGTIRVGVFVAEDFLGSLDVFGEDDELDATQPEVAATIIAAYETLDIGSFERHLGDVRFDSIQVGPKDTEVWCTHHNTYEEGMPCVTETQGNPENGEG